MRINDIENFATDFGIRRYFMHATMSGNYFQSAIISCVPRPRGFARLSGLMARSRNSDVSESHTIRIKMLTSASENKRTIELAASIVIIRLGTIILGSPQNAQAILQSFSPSTGNAVRRAGISYGIRLRAGRRARAKPAFTLVVATEARSLAEVAGDIQGPMVQRDRLRYAPRRVSDNSEVDA